MATWHAGTNEGASLGSFKSKSAMFDAMRCQFGIGGEFSCVSSQGAFYAFEITKYGYHATEKCTPPHLERSGCRL